MTSYLKTERRVDTYLPARENMTIFQEAVKTAAANGKWQKHPNPKRKTQKIQLVTDLGFFWESGAPEMDVPINACVVHDTKTDKFFVFMTTATFYSIPDFLSSENLNIQRAHRLSIRGCSPYNRTGHS